MEYKTSCFNIITNYDETKLVLKKIEDKFYLPFHNLDEEEKIFIELKKQTGLETALLYFLDLKFSEKEKTEDITNLYLAEESETINDFHWINLNHLNDNFVDYQYIKKWLNQTRNKEFSVPWFNKDWSKKIKPQIISILTNQGFKSIISITQYYVSAISCILKIETEKGFIFCKSVLPPIFKNEPKITQALTSYLPDYFPEIVFTDNKQGLILTKDFGKDILSENKDFDNWLKTVKSYAKLQIEMIKNKDQLLNEGMFNRSLDSIGQQLKDMLKMSDKIFLDQENSITSEELNKLTDNFEKVENLIKELQFYNIPETIEHGDLHAGNIAIKDNRIIFYDWSDCAISHPFISMRVFFWNFFDKDGKIKEKLDYFPDISNSYNLLVDSYLNEWSEYGSKEDLKKAFEISQKVSYIAFVIQYIALVDSMEEHTKTQYKGHIARGLKKIISFL